MNIRSNIGLPAPVRQAELPGIGIAGPSTESHPQQASSWGGKRKRPTDDDVPPRPNFGPGPVTRRSPANPNTPRTPGDDAAIRLQEMRRAKNNDSAKRSRLKKMASCIRLQGQIESWRNNAGYWKDIAMFYASLPQHSMAQTLELVATSTDLKEVEIPSGPNEEVEEMRREIEAKLASGQLAGLGEAFLGYLTGAVGLPRYPDPMLRPHNGQEQQPNMRRLSPSMNFLEQLEWSEEASRLRKEAEETADGVREHIAARASGDELASNVHPQLSLPIRSRADNFQPPRLPEIQKKSYPQSRSTSGWGESRSLAQSDVSTSGSNEQAQSDGQAHNTSQNSSQHTSQNASEYPSPTLLGVQQQAQTAASPPQSQGQDLPAASNSDLKRVLAPRRVQELSRRPQPTIDLTQADSPPLESVVDPRLNDLYLEPMPSDLNPEEQ